MTKKIIPFLTIIALLLFSCKTASDEDSSTSSNASSSSESSSSSGSDSSSESGSSSSTSSATTYSVTYLDGVDDDAEALQQELAVA